jgi:hypothetical protein
VAKMMHKGHLFPGPMRLTVRTYRLPTLGAFMCAALACGSKGLTAGQLDSEIGKAIAPCADTARVVSVLDSMKIQHSPSDAKTRQILAIVRDVSRTASTRRAIQLVFVFDDRARLLSHTAKDVFTGP